MAKHSYRIFWTIKCTPLSQIWEEDGGASYSPNVAYLARGSGGAGFFALFPSSKT